MPSAYNDRAEVREIEPYVHCQSTHGRHSPRHGVSRLPWLSGTATWSYVTATQHILGVRPDWDGLRISPCIPAAWDGFKIKRRFRGATYDVVVTNPRHVERGVRSLKVDGKLVDPSLPLPQAPAAQRGARRGRTRVEGRRLSVDPFGAPGQAWVRRKRCRATTEAETSRSNPAGSNPVRPRRTTSRKRVLRSC